MTEDYLCKVVTSRRVSHSNGMFAGVTVNLTHFPGDSEHGEAYTISVVNDDMDADFEVGVADRVVVAIQQLALSVPRGKIMGKGIVQDGVKHG